VADIVKAVAISDKTLAWLDAFEAAVTLTDASVRAFVNDDPEQAALFDAATRLQEVADNLRLIQSDLAVALGKQMEVEDIDVLERFDGWAITRKWSTSRKGWQHQKLAKIVSERLVNLSIDQATGERLSTPEEMIVALLKYAGVGYWKVKPLAELGVNADMYCETGGSSATISVRRPR
jgi:hypothetical protein